MSNEIATQNKATVSIIDGYSSITGDDFEARSRVFKAVSDAKPLSDVLDKPLNIVDIIVQPVTVENEETGEVDGYLRTTLIDAQGNAHTTGSAGVASAVKNMLDIFGQPEGWPKGGLAVKVVERKGNKGYKFFTIIPA